MSASACGLTRLEKLNLSGNKHLVSVDAGFLDLEGSGTTQKLR